MRRRVFIALLGAAARAQQQSAKIARNG